MKIKIKAASKELKETMKDFCKANVNDEEACQKATENLKSYKDKAGWETSTLSGEAVVEIAKSEILLRQEKERMRVLRPK